VLQREVPIGQRIHLCLV